MAELAKQWHFIYENPYESAEIKLDGKTIKFRTLKGYVTEFPYLKGQLCFIAKEDYYFDENDPVYLGIYHGDELTEQPEDTTFVFQMGRKFIDGGPLGNFLRWINHSEYENNVEAVLAMVLINGEKKQVILYKLKNSVLKGQQVLVNYGNDYFVNIKQLFFSPDDNDENVEELFSKNRKQYSKNKLISNHEHKNKIKDNNSSYYVSVVIECMIKGMDELRKYLYSMKNINLDLPFLEVTTQGELLPMEQQSKLTPLMYAALTGNLAAFGMLLEFGANIKRRQIFTGHTALFYVVSGNGSDQIKQAMISLLIKHKINLTAQDCDGLTIFHWCVKNNDFATLMFLCRTVSGNKILDYINNEGLCVVIYALALDKKEMFAYLIGRYKKKLVEDGEELSKELQIAKKINPNYSDYSRFLADIGLDKYLDENAKDEHNQTASEQEEHEENAFSEEGYGEDEYEEDEFSEKDGLEEESYISENASNSSECENNNNKRRKKSSEKKKNASKDSEAWKDVIFEFNLYKKSCFILVSDKQNSNERVFKIYKRFSSLCIWNQKKNTDVPLLKETGRPNAAFFYLYLNKEATIQDMFAILKKVLPVRQHGVQVKFKDINGNMSLMSLEVFMDNYEKLDPALDILDESDLKSYFNKTLKAEVEKNKQAGLIVKKPAKPVKPYLSIELWKNIRIEAFLEQSLVSCRENHKRIKRICWYAKIISKNNDTKRILTLYKRMSCYKKIEDRLFFNIKKNGAEFTVGFVNVESLEAGLKILRTVLPKEGKKTKIEIIDQKGAKSFFLDAEPNEEKAEKYLRKKQISAKVRPAIEQDANNNNQAQEEQIQVGKRKKDKISRESFEIGKRSKPVKHFSSMEVWSDIRIEAYIEKGNIAYGSKQKKNQIDCWRIKIISTKQEAKKICNHYKLLVLRKQKLSSQVIVTIESKKHSTEFTVGFPEAESIEEAIKIFQSILPKEGKKITIERVSSNMDTNNNNAHQEPQAQQALAAPMETEDGESSRNKVPQAENKENQQSDIERRKKKFSSAVWTNILIEAYAEKQDITYNNKRSRQNKIKCLVIKVISTNQDCIKVLNLYKNISDRKYKIDSRVIVTIASKKSLTEFTVAFPDVDKIEDAVQKFKSILPKGAKQLEIKVIAQNADVLGRNTTNNKGAQQEEKEHQPSQETHEIQVGQQNQKEQQTPTETDASASMKRNSQIENEKIKESNADVRIKRKAPDAVAIWENISIEAYADKQKIIAKNKGFSQKNIINCFVIKIISTNQDHSNIFKRYKDICHRKQKLKSKVIVTMPNIETSTEFTVGFPEAKSLEEAIQIFKSLLPKEGKKIPINIIGPNINSNDATIPELSDANKLSPYSSQTFFKPVDTHHLGMEHPFGIEQYKQFKFAEAMQIINERQIQTIPFISNDSELLTILNQANKNSHLLVIGRGDGTRSVYLRYFDRNGLQQLAPTTLCINACGNFYHEGKLISSQQELEAISNSIHSNIIVSLVSTALNPPGN